MAKSLKGVLKIVHPINRGKIEDWSSIEKLIHKKFYTDLRIDPSEKDIAVIIPPHIIYDDLFKLIDIFFQTFNVKSLYIIPEPVAISLYNKKLNSIIFHCGYSYVYIARIENGLLDRHSVKNYSYGLRDIASYFKKMLRVKGDIGNLDIDDIISLLFEMGKVSLDIKSEKIDEIEYMLPTGDQIILSNELYLAPELLFNPKMIGLDQDGISSALTKYIENQNRNSPVILSGGCMFLDGFIERIEEESRINLLIPEDNLYQEWKGASFLVKKDYIKPFTKNHYNKIRDKDIVRYIPWF